MALVPLHKLSKKIPRGNLANALHVVSRGSYLGVFNGMASRYLRPATLLDAPLQGKRKKLSGLLPKGSRNDQGTSIRESELEMLALSLLGLSPSRIGLAWRTRKACKLRPAKTFAGIPKSQNMCALSQSKRQYK